MYIQSRNTIYIYVYMIAGGTYRRIDARQTLMFSKNSRLGHRSITANASKMGGTNAATHFLGRKVDTDDLP